jgi:[protein-PII] uridylyltransferase
LSAREVSIQGAKIQTLGERVEDIFFLADASGGPLQDAKLLSDLEEELITALGVGQASGETTEMSI